MEAGMEKQITGEPSSGFTEPAPPKGLRVFHISSESVTLQWETPAGEVEKFIVTCYIDEELVQTLMTDTNSLTITNLKPGVSHSLLVSALLKDGRKRKSAMTSAETKTQLESFLEDLGLEEHYKEKISLSQILQIDEKTISDEPAMSKPELPWYFLKKLMMVNVTARNVKCLSECESNCDEASGEEIFDLDNLDSCPTSADMLNPLDLITALFLCSDGFVQQEMALKMSMCQFSVPLLLPNCDTNQCTLMLWAMRDIVKKYRPESLSELKGFTEERIVLSEIPMISFVRLGKCSLSKSEILNELLSNSQQYHDTFVHHNMNCGNSQRRISSGLTEITWYLPGGNKNIDIFSQPVAVANLRGDIACFDTQYSFLCHTSSAVFVFFDNLDSDRNLLKHLHKSEIFLVGNLQSSSFNLTALKQVATEMSLKKNNIILRKMGMNDADFAKCLQKKMCDIVEKTTMKMRIDKMADIAHELGILVDEDFQECQNGKKLADTITEEIQDILKYKEDQLPLQGQIWKDFTSLEKEEFRLRKLGSKNLEEYKSDLHTQKKQLREKQNSYEISSAMTHFVIGISSPPRERCYFLKWMRLNLDNMSRQKLLRLREQYKEKCKNLENAEEIKKLDQQFSNCSLGIEHFFREMGQIYEASRSLPETNPSRKQLDHLPKLCAQLLLDGFPIELVDGDVSNIPLLWVSEVLSQLNGMVGPQNKIRVVTVLGVQSTGKSTLLNTMFGVQFAVSSGRCTRGAFMLLITVDDNFKKVLNCDFVMIIDTEGLKSPELAELENSYEHDNELATLVVGLSDVTIINIAMENSTEMKDILQIVVHAFLRMKEVGKKPLCHFVHQNVSDVSAHEKNLRDRKKLLEQLNEMTRAAARMERKGENKSFTDVMEYSPDTGNCYVPGLWTGNPPMAPVNAGYSEAAFELKRNIIQQLGHFQKSANNILEFKVWIRSLWNAVKHENFIFSFRNSLVADAYTNLCTEFNKWEWEFKKEMYTWTTEAKTKISNHGTIGAKSEISDMGNLIAALKIEATSVLSTWETKICDNLTEYFKRTDGHVYLVEGYKEEFVNSAKMLGKELRNSTFNELTVAGDIRQGMAKVDEIKENHTNEIEKAVCALLDDCRKKKVQMTDGELDCEFNRKWRETLSKLSFPKQEIQDVFDHVSHYLGLNMSHRGSHARSLLSKKNLKDCGQESFIHTVKGTIDRIINTVKEFFTHKGATVAVQKMADEIINNCKEFVDEKVQQKSSYHNNYILEILNMIDDHLKTNQDLKTDTEFEVSLKQHICGFAARKFQKMHEDFIEANDPYRSLEKNKERFCADFRDLFHERDQCQKKAEEFTTQCLKPAVEDFVRRSLGLNIIDEMLKQKQFSTRMDFQYSIMLDLLSKNDIYEYVSYISSYESYVKEWILKNIKQHFSNTSMALEFENRHLQSCISSIKDAIKKAINGKREDLKTFVENICKELADKLIISQDALGVFMALNKADLGQFSQCLTGFVMEMAETLRVTFEQTSFKNKLKHLHPQPQNELFTRVIGCGKQCPFCKVPCDAGGKAHTQHWASLHRPKGLGRRRWEDTEKLTTDVCSSSVNSGTRFKCHETGGKFHPYKDYRDIFPDWDIPSDISLEASDYWKYVMTLYNDDFAEEYDAQPADIPETWKTITKTKATKSLKESFGFK